MTQNQDRGDYERLVPLKDLPRSVIGFSAEGTVTGEDYKTVLIPAVEEALTSGGKIRFLYVLGPDFKTYAPGAMWDDTLFGARHYFDFEKIACVTDHEVYARDHQELRHADAGGCQGICRQGSGRGQGLARRVNREHNRAKAFGGDPDRDCRRLNGSSAQA